MTTEEMIEIAKDAGFREREGVIRTMHSSGAWVAINDELERFAALLEAMVAAKERKACAEQYAELLAKSIGEAEMRERERIVGKRQHDGDMRLMLHRWEDGQCWAESTHFTAAETRFGPSGILDRAVERMSANIDASIRARGQKDDGEIGAQQPSP